MAWEDDPGETVEETQEGAGVVLPPEPAEEKALEAFKELDPDVAARRFLALEKRVTALEAKTNRPR